jgi:hypothetical protein
MKKSYSILATIALALSLNSVAAWAAEKLNSSAKNEKNPKNGGDASNQEKPEEIKIMEKLIANVGSPDCRTGGL